MDDSRNTETLVINSDLNGVNDIIEELDGIIQTTGNMELSKTLNEISESYELLKGLLKVKGNS